MGTINSILNVVLMKFNKNDRFMKYLMILLMAMGLCTFSMAQDYNNLDRDTPMNSDSKAPMENKEMNQSKSSSSSEYNNSTSSSVVTPEVISSEKTTTVT